MAPNRSGSSKQADEDKSKGSEEPRPGTSSELPTVLKEAQKLAAIIAEQQRQRSHQDDRAASKLFKRSVSPPVQKKRKYHELSEDSEGSESEEDSDSDDSDSSACEFHGFSSRDVAAAEKEAQLVVNPPLSTSQLVDSFLQKLADPEASASGRNESASAVDDPNDLMSMIQSYFNNSSPKGEVKIGPAVDSQLVHLLLPIWENGDKLALSTDKLYERIVMPANCAFITQIDLNPAVEVEAKKRSWIINRDIALKAIQRALIKSGHALSLLADRIINLLKGGARKECLNLLANALDCVALASGKISMSRKYNLRDCVDNIYQPLLKKNGTSGGLLLGTNLLQDMKDCEETEKLRQKTRPKPWKKYGGKKFHKFSRKGKSGKYHKLIYDLHISDEEDPLKGLTEIAVTQKLLEVVNLGVNLAENLVDQSLPDSNLLDDNAPGSKQSVKNSLSNNNSPKTSSVLDGSTSKVSFRLQEREALQKEVPWRQTEEELSSIFPQPSQVKNDSGYVQQEFKAEGIKRCFKKWLEITSDSNILDMVKGCGLEFSEIPTQDSLPRQIKFSEKEKIAIDLEIEKMRKKGIIEIAEHEKGEYISNLFTRPKRDSEDLRTILNLREMNQNIVYHHFKIDDLPHALTLLRPGYFMAVIDIKEGFHNISIKQKFRKYLRFIHNGELLQYTSLAMGLAPAPRYFTKLLKVPLAFLREKHGILCSAFFDDIIVVMRTLEGLKRHVKIVLELLEDLGYIINYVKSWLLGYQILKYLGMILNTCDMIVYLPQEKITAIQDLGATLLNSEQVKIRTFASFIGMCVATFPGNKYGPLHSKCLEQAKILALEESDQDFDAFTILGEKEKHEIHWWISNVHKCSKEILVSEPDKIIYTDSSKSGYGFHEPSSGRKGGAMDRTGK